MKAEALAALHVAAFGKAGWSATAIGEMLARPAVRVLQRPGGFLMAQVIAPEAEILTLAVDPARQRQGVAGGLVKDLLALPEVETAFLEVAEDNAAARALYTACGFAETGRRRGYYARAGGAVDAVLMGWARGAPVLASARGIG
ncbi:MAG: GNAT family N-acetyltransferase [Pseudomonadota bacterium]